MTPRYDRAEVHRALELIHEPGHVVEVRALKATTTYDTWPKTRSGYFDNADTLLDALDDLVSWHGVYITLNQIDPALMARANNRIKKAEATTSDADVTRRRWLPIDLDAKRPSGISATDAEHDAAIARAYAVRDYLKGEDWPDPIVADSGNGAHLLYRVDLPVDDDTIKACLKSLAARFNDGAVEVDASVHNPARIWKLYGMLVCKGDPMEDRPHRMARILEAPA